MDSIKFHSKLDSSVNFMVPSEQDPNLFFEARFVQRSPAYFICYLSSHTGCNKTCRMCHLTQTGQTQMIPATMQDIRNQAFAVLMHYHRLVAEFKIPKARKIHFNFMARGEPLANDSVIFDNSGLSFTRQLRQLPVEGLEIAINISTIMPSGMYAKHIDALGSYYLVNTPYNEFHTIYYSLYSCNKDFRKRWLPKAMIPENALSILGDYKDKSGKVKFHWSLIEGENDSLQDAKEIVSLIYAYNMRDCDVNIVRYNPFSDAQGKESTNKEYIQYLKEKLASVRVIPRVGFDVSASCGMFLTSYGTNNGRI